MTRTPGTRPGGKKAVKKKAVKKKAVKKKAVRKKPPRKKDEPTKPKARRRNKAYAESEVARVLPPVDVPTGKAGGRWDAVRSRAGMHFVYDAHQQSARWWRDQHYTQVPWDTFRNWSQHDEWIKRREEHWLHTEAAVTRKIVSDTVRDQVDEVVQISEARTVALSFVLGGEDEKGEPIAIPPPKSYEGAVGAFVKLDERLDKKRETVVDGLPLALGSSTTAEVIGTDVSFTPEEFAAMAEAKMRVQQKRLDESLSTPDVSEDEGKG